MNTSSSTHQRNHRHLGRHLQRCALPLVLMLGLGGCAQFVGQSDQAIPIRSTPENATVVIRDRQGNRVFKGTTPTIVSLPKSDGSYFGGQRYDVELSLPGHQSRRVTLYPNTTLGYVLGNILWGWPVGVIGGLMIDPWSGHMYNLSPHTVNVQLGLPPEPEPSAADDEPALVKP